MAIYRQDVKICATAYIRADSAEEAARIVKEKLSDTGAELPVGEGIEIAVSDRMFNDPRLPDVSLSPAVSFYGAWDRLSPEDVDD
jgi:hypothetical protein